MNALVLHNPHAYPVPKNQELEQRCKTTQNTLKTWTSRNPSGVRPLTSGGAKRPTKWSDSLHLGQRGGTKWSDLPHPS